MSAVSQVTDRRRHRRLPMMFEGSFALSQLGLFPCRSIDISPGGINVQAAEAVVPGTRIALHFEEFGRLVGVTRRMTKNGFGVALHASTDDREKFIARLTWLFNKSPLGLRDMRRHPRHAPTKRSAELQLQDGSFHLVQIDDISKGGALLTTNMAISQSSLVHFEGRASRVVRTSKTAVGISFIKPMEAVETDMQLGIDRGLKVRSEPRRL